MCWGLNLFLSAGARDAMEVVRTTRTTRDFSSNRNKMDFLFSTNLIPSIIPYEEPFCFIDSKDLRFALDLTRNIYIYIYVPFCGWVRKGDWRLRTLRVGGQKLSHRSCTDQGITVYLAAPRWSRLSRQTFYNKQWIVPNLQSKRGGCWSCCFTLWCTQGYSTTSTVAWRFQAASLRQTGKPGLCYRGVQLGSTRASKIRLRAIRTESQRWITAGPTGVWYSHSLFTRSPCDIIPKICAGLYVEVSSVRSSILSYSTRNIISVISEPRPILGAFFSTDTSWRREILLSNPLDAPRWLWISPLLPKPSREMPGKIKKVLQIICSM